MNAGAKGRRAEWKTRDWLAKEGYEVVRAAGSKGVFDLVAFNREEVLLVQVKVNRGASPAERQAMAHFMAPPNTRRYVVRWNDRVPGPVVYQVPAA